MTEKLVNSHRYAGTVKDEDLAIVRLFQNSLGIRHRRAAMIVKTAVRQLAQIVINNKLVELDDIDGKKIAEQMEAIEFFTDKEQAKDRNTSYTIRKLRLEISQLKDKIQQMEKKAGALRFVASMGPAKQRPLSERKADAKKRGWKWDEENDRLMTNDDGSAVMLEEEV